MNLPELLQQLDAGAIIELFEVDATSISGVPTDVFRFHAGTNNISQPVVWQGLSYTPMPVEASGFDLTPRGTLPRPVFKVANLSGSISALMISFEDLVGAKVTRKRTFARYLDGQPGADPTQYLPDDIYFVERKVSETHVAVELELASALDLEGVELPSRPILVDVCAWQYRSAECSYTGSNYFNVNDDPVSLFGQDVCSHKVTGCKKRFGARGVLPFGGFPAAKLYKT